MKLSIKIPLFFGIIILVISSSIGLTSIYIASNILHEVIVDAMKAETDANSKIISERMDRQLDILHEIANRARTRSMDWETVRPSLVPDVQRIGSLDIAMIFPNGDASFVIGGNTINVSDRDYFRMAMGGRGNIAFVVSRLSGEVVVLFVTPIFRDDNPNAPVLGVLMARKDGTMISMFTNSLDTSMSTGRYIIVDADGTAIAHQNADLVINQFNAINEARSDSSLKTLGNSIARAISETSGYIAYDFGGKKTVGYFTNIDGLAWKLIFSMEQAELDGEVAQIRNAAVGIAVVLIIIGMLLSFFIGRSIAKPISTVANNLKDIARGEGDLTKTISAKTKDEIGDLAMYFNETLNKIKNLVINIRKQADSLAVTGDSLSSNMNETAAAVNEITSNIQGVKTRILTQSASVSETHATMEQVSVNIGKLNTHVENQNTNISQASSAIEEMVANTRSVTDTLVKNSSNVKSLLGASEIGRKGLHDVAEDIQEISRESEGLMEINAMMESIASQTNLLSMNAAIEAAHAGEAGKGFAVVAGEIRKLAESSSRQSKTISDVLKKIKTSIDKIKSSTDNVLDKFEAIDSSVKTVAEQEENIRRAMEEQEVGSKQILEGVGNINVITGSVKSSSHEMLEGSTEVIREIENLEKITHEITSGMNEMATGADEINVAVNHVNDITHQNRENIDLLIKEVSRFKTE